MAFRGNGQVLFISCIDKITDHECDRFPAGNLVQELQRGCQGRAFFLRLIVENIADHAQDMPRTLARRKEVLDFIGEENQPDPVIVLDGGEREDGGHLSGQVAFDLAVTPEIIGTADVDQSPDFLLP